MSRPAARTIPQRIAACPTCDARPYRPCVRLDDDLDKALDHGWHVSPHAARLRAEEALRAERKSR